ncbi:MAG: SPFH domain-containing protein, partial [Planctomycetota bacterium]
LSTLQGWKYGFESPFKAEVYFVSTRQFTDMKWGTKNPIMLRDPEFGPVRLRAFGNYAMKVSDPAKLIREIVGTDGHFTLEEMSEQLRNIILTRFTDLLGESQIPVLDLAANYNELSEFVTNQIGGEYAEYGIEVTKFLVENISLPPAVEQALDKRSSMGVLGNLNQYTQYQAANSMEDLANNPGTGGGMAGGGMGMGMGYAMAQQMGQATTPQQQQNQQPQGNQQAAPPPIPQAVRFYLVLNGQQAGPFDINALGGKVQSGELTPKTLVWKQGMANWAKAGQVSELQPLFQQSGPPPVPPAPPSQG